jgi:hypothetical protein
MAGKVHQHSFYVGWGGWGLPADTRGSSKTRHDSDNGIDVKDDDFDWTRDDYNWTGLNSNDNKTE